MSNLTFVSRADDIGVTPGANRAGIFAVEQGITRNVSIMVPTPAFADAARLFAGYKKADLGLHVTLTSEWDRLKWGPILPAKKVPSLVDEQGYFLHRPPEYEKRGMDIEQAMAEVKAQLDLARSHGLEFQYLDEHMVVGDVKGLRAALNDFAQREGLLSVAHIPFIGDWEPREDYAQYWIDLIESSPEGTFILVAHPTFEDEQSLLMRENVSSLREAERKALADPRVSEACRKRGGRFVRFTEVLG